MNALNTILGALLPIIQNLGELLPWVEYSYNTTYHTSMGITPF